MSDRPGLRTAACYTVAALLSAMSAVTAYLGYHLSASLLMISLALLLVYLGSGGTLRFPSGKQ